MKNDLVCKVGYKSVKRVFLGCVRVFYVFVEVMIEIEKELYL